MNRRLLLAGAEGGHAKGILVQVKDRNTNVPVSGATVMYKTTTGGAWATVGVTGLDGQFFIDSAAYPLQEHTFYQIGIQKSGYTPTNNTRIYYETTLEPIIIATVYLSAEPSGGGGGGGNPLYTLSFETDGGTTLNPMTLTAGTSIPLPQPVKEMYTLIGWATSRGGSAVYPAGSTYTMPAKDTTLYAVWEISITPKPER